MSNKGLTIGIIFDASSLNYGEGIGNIAELKKVTRKGKSYTRVSRQALCYNIRTQMGYKLADVIKSDSKKSKKIDELVVGGETAEDKAGSKKSVIQFHPDATIKDFAEMDLFGYMRTEENSTADTRTGVARVTDAISLSPYNYDMDFLTNKGLADRISKYNSILNSEIHSSLYAYTLSIDLDDVGVHKEKNVTTHVITNEEKANRVCALLKTIEHLYRDIKGRRENLAPVFVIGGIYPAKNNYFNGRLSLKDNKLAISTIKEAIDEPLIKENTKIGLLSDVFNNEEEIREEFNPVTIHQFFKNLCDETIKYYEVKEEA